MNVVEAVNVNKNYNSFQALKQVNFSIKRGQIVGLIGANGAGKTTLIKAMLGLTNFSGDLSVLGMHPRKNRVQLMQRLCFIADVAVLPRWLSVAKAIDFVEGVHPRFNRYKALEFLAKTNIKHNQKVKELSKGMVVQLHLALVMAIEVEVLLLDEPTLGLDILYRSKFYHSLLDDYYNENRTIIITTHQLEEVESLLTDLMIVHQGELILNDSIEGLRERYTELTVTPDQVRGLKAFKPILERQQIGRVKLLFEDQDINELKNFGEISVPSINDIFLAKVSGGKDA